MKGERASVRKELRKRRERKELTLRSKQGDTFIIILEFGTIKSYTLVIVI
jgi:hypothetical protein